MQYRAGQDLGLDMHTDACDVTLNVCLGRGLLRRHASPERESCSSRAESEPSALPLCTGKDFTGAGLTLCGLRGSAAGDERRFCHRHEHVRGAAIESHLECVGV